MKTKERPIIMGAESIRAIYAERKTQTRRVVKPQPEREDTFWKSEAGWFGVDETTKTRGPNLQCPYGQPGDRLWVREVWWQAESKDMGVGVPFVFYDEAQRKGSHLLGPRLPWGDTPIGRWGKRSPLFMPRWASRLLLEVMAVRVERLQDMTAADLLAEGIPREYDENPIQAWRNRWRAFKQHWDILNAKRGFSWDSNPLVWVVVFRVLTGAAA